MNKWLRIGGSAVLAFSLLSVPFMDAAAVEAKGRTSMSYISFINKDQYNYYIDRTHNSLNVVTPNYFSLNSDGTLKINTAFIDPSFINEMHNEGVRVVPFIQNAWGDGTALTNRDALSQQIANAIATYNLDGVNVDLEGLNETH
ncbi:MAG TPA: glycoside hydrolase, partial [Paenibacillaceae bacterium]|nr:glycoside hydrolase [Paenibacillaceae bacterium]